MHQAKEECSANKSQTPLFSSGLCSANTEQHCYEESTFWLLSRIWLLNVNKEVGIYFVPCPFPFLVCLYVTAGCTCMYILPVKHSKHFVNFADSQCTLFQMFYFIAMKCNYW